MYKVNTYNNILKQQFTFLEITTDFLLKSTQGETDLFWVYNSCVYLHK